MVPWVAVKTAPLANKEQPNSSEARPVATSGATGFFYLQYRLLGGFLI
jgi:hypothetical protein